MATRFYAKPIWDPEAEVWISDSNIIGLHLEAKTLAEFEELVDEFAAELILSNHFRGKLPSDENLGSWLPTVVINQPGTLADLADG
ncbi:MAG: DUF1902 domain-containing protein [Pseudomonadota bacterium]